VSGELLCEPSSIPQGKTVTIMNSFRPYAEIVGGRSSASKVLKFSPFESDVSFELIIYYYG